MFDENKYIGVEAKTSASADMSSPGTVNSYNDNLAKYGNFDLAMDSFYHQENLTLEGMRELYFPIDNSFEEYVRVADNSNLNYVISNGGSNITLSADQDYYKSGFNWLIYTLGAPASSACLKIDIYCNFECLPNAEFLNYLPLSMSPYHISSYEKNQIHKRIQGKPIMKANEIEEENVPSIWLKLKKKFGNSLPGIKQMISKGIINAVPSLKPGLSLAGSMIIDNDYY